MSDLEAAEESADRLYMRSMGGSETEALADVLRSVIMVLRRLEEAVPGIQERLTELADEFRAVKEKVDSIPGVWGDGE